MKAVTRNLSKWGAFEEAIQKDSTQTSVLVSIIAVAFALLQVALTGDPW
jgi:hypothetical protein